MMNNKSYSDKVVEARQARNKVDDSDWSEELPPLSIVTLFDGEQVQAVIPYKGWFVGGTETERFNVVYDHALNAFVGRFGQICIRSRA